jgi:phosphatidylglycerol---prolipoprotein diacylglyceryl transferase
MVALHRRLLPAALPGAAEVRPLDPEAVGDLITALVIGVLLGARIGYILFYDPASFASDPARIIRIWEGGLSFHGGLIGAVIGAWWFARKHGASR